MEVRAEDKSISKVLEGFSIVVSGFLLITVEVSSKNSLNNTVEKMWVPFLKKLLLC